MQILKEHKNTIFEVIQSSGFDTSLFTLKPDPDYKDTFNVKYLDTDMIFQISYVDGYDRFYYGFRPFHPSKKWIGNRHINPLGSTIGTFRNWLDMHLKRFIKNELEIDFWETVKPDSENELELNTYFTKDEQSQIIGSLELFREAIKTEFGTTNYQLEQINKRLDHLEKSVSKQTKFDYKAIVGKVFMDIVKILVLDEGNVIKLRTIFITAFKIVKDFFPLLLY